MNTVNVREAQSRLQDLLDLVALGEVVVITRGDRPVAKLVPAEGATAQSSGERGGTEDRLNDLGDAMDSSMDDFKRFLG